MSALSAGRQTNPETTAALSRAIAALHGYLDLEQDPQKRSTATQCLSRLESLRSNHMRPPTQGGGQGGGGAY